MIKLKQEDIYIVMVKQLNRFIKNMEVLEKYYENGYKIEWSLEKSNLVITYQEKIYIINIVLKKNDFYWILEHNHHSILEKRVDDENKNLYEILDKINK